MRVSKSQQWLLASVALLAAPIFGQSRYLLQTASPQDATRVTSQYGLTLLQTVREEETDLYVVTLPPGASATEISAIRSDPAVKELVPDSEVDGTEEKSGPPLFTRSLDSLTDALVSHATVQFYGVPVRSGYVQQPATTLIHLAQMQQQFPTGNSIVAVIDTGVDPTHPALAGVLVPGYDFVHDVPGLASDLSDLQQSTVAILDQSTVAILDQKNYPLILNQSTVAILDQSTVAILDGHKLPKDFGHGTMVSGLIHLVAPTARIMPLKAFSADGSANLSDVIRAIYYAADHNAKVINMSFSFRGHSAQLAQAVQYAASHGVILIAAAGNDGRESEVYPAAFDSVIGVGATDKLDLRSPFSNYGEDCTKMAAPGEAIVTTYPGNNYAAVWGTSFSTALVSGASALVADLVPSARSDYVRTAFDQGPQINQGMGHARLDLLPTMLYCQSKPSWSSSGN